MNEENRDAGTKLQALRRQYRDQLQGQIAQVVLAWRRAEKRNYAAERLIDVHGLAHNLAGAGAIFGYTGVSEVGANLEALISAVIRAEASMTKQRCQKIVRLLDALPDLALEPDAEVDQVAPNAPTRATKNPRA